jgi:hypothetical protein
MDAGQLAAEFQSAVSGPPDYVALERLCHENISFEALNIMRFKGRDRLLGVVRLDHEVHTGYQAEIVEILVQDETSVCVRSRVSVEASGRMVTPTREYEATGKPWSVDTLNWFHVSDDVITRAVFAFNYLSMWTQGGYIDSP